jgi:hypothetical protein
LIGKRIQKVKCFLVVTAATIAEDLLVGKS